MKEIKSPFDAADGGNTTSTDAQYIPPILPGNRPKGYQGILDKSDDVHQKNQASNQKDRREVRRKEQAATNSIQAMEPENNGNGYYL